MVSNTKNRNLKTGFDLLKNKSTTAGALKPIRKAKLIKPKVMAEILLTDVAEKAGNEIIQRALSKIAKCGREKR